MTAEKGDLYMADTNGFHRGTKLKKNFRCLFKCSLCFRAPYDRFSRQSNKLKKEF